MGTRHKSVNAKPLEGMTPAADPKGLYNVHFRPQTMDYVC